jgi:2'-5' RNA ligase
MEIFAVFLNLSRRYNCVSMPGRYALVAYVTNPVGQFLEALRRELHPALPHSGAHLTILPPRLLNGSEEEALAALQTLGRQSSPFHVTLGDVETFLPVTPTVYVRVLDGAEHMRALHQVLNTGALASCEIWPYSPHLTIVKMETPADAQAALTLARSHWQGYQGTRSAYVSELAFVREQADATWTDLGHVSLLAPTHP